MKKMLKKSWLMLLAAVSLVACSDDATFDWPTEIPESTVEEIQGGLRSTFYLPPTWGRMAERDVQIEFKSRDSREAHLFDAKLTVDQRAKVVFDIEHAKAHLLASGDYQVRCYIEGKALPLRFRVRLKDKKIHYLEPAHIYSSYSGGDGSASNPYQIKDNVDFRLFVNDLAEDSWYGDGAHFKQMGDFEIAAREGLIDEEGWIGEPFAGSYDGDGHSISGLYYIGTRSNIGLFTELLYNAEVKNLTINVKRFDTSGDNVGALAGIAYDDVIVKNCKVSGVISGNNNVGGLIGQLYRLDSAEFTGIDVAVVIEDCQDCVGGLFGYIYAGVPITIDQVTTQAHSFSIKGARYVGGVVGYVKNTQLTIKHAELIHTSYATSSTMTVIGGGYYVGGLVGYFVNHTSADLDLTIVNSSVCCTVRGSGDYVGGIAGYVGDAEHLDLMNVTASSAVSGGMHVGGMFGASDAKRMVIAACAVTTENLNATSVTGRENVGGFVGSTSTMHWTLVNKNDQKALYMSIDVAASERNAGGLAGLAEVCDVWLGRITFNPAMLVKAPYACGGVYGKASYVSLYGDYKVDFGTYATIPKENDEATFSVNVSGTEYVGGLVGHLSDSGSRVSYTHARCTVTGSNYVGGLVGYQDSGNTISQCAAGGIVYGEGDFTGGLVGRLEGGTVKESINYTTVDGAYYTGGLVGGAYRSGSAFPLVDLCVNVGAVTGTDVVGGNVGLMNIDHDSFQTIVIHCANFGKIVCESGNLSSSDSGFGGIVGISEAAGSEVHGCANHGEIQGKLRAHGGGGIAGWMGNDPSGTEDSYNFKIRNCINTGNISNTNAECHLGGIIGYAEEGDNAYHPDAAILGCLNKGRITSKQDEDWGTGGIAGQLDWYGHIEFCSCLPKDQLSDYGYHPWEGGVKYDAALYESYRVRNVVEYKSQPADAFSALGTTYWHLPSGTGYPELKDCPFQHTTY